MNLCRTTLTSITTAVILLSCSFANACSVPVFRYALERWVPDDYIAVITAQEPLPDPISNSIEKMRSSGMNIRIQNGNTKNLIAANSNGELRLYFPENLNISNPVWTGSLTTNSIKAVMISPMRKKIANMILEGESVVWLMLECSDPQKNKVTRKLLEEELARNQANLQLPLIDEADAHIAEAAGRAPLKIAFSMLSLSRNDPDETVLVNTLLNVYPEHHKINDPIVFPICGAGRAFPPLIGSTISAENINRICIFLTGECSCEIKGQNPGFDLPIAIDWNCSECGSLYTETALPPLTGVIPEAETAPEIESKNSCTNKAAQPAQNITSPSDSGKTGPTPARAIIITLILTALLTAAASILIIRKSSRK